jgi:voltage-gated potassium channel
MYAIEKGESGFKNIPDSIYWVIVTLTTVGYGDIVPITTIGKMIASLIMVMGYGIIAVPTGIVTAEFMNAAHKHPKPKRICAHCGKYDHREQSIYCYNCGFELENE